MAERKIIVNGGSDNARERASGDLYAHVAQTLWAEKDSATTAGTGVESNVYLYTLPANTLSTNESVLTFTYNGVFAANARAKYVRVKWASTQLNIEDEFADNNTAWQIKGEIMRASSSIIECTVAMYRHNVVPYVKYTEISSLNLTGAEYDISVELETPDAAGDITVHNGRIVFYPTPG